MNCKTLCSVVAGTVFAGFSLSAFADVKEHPFQVIIARNPFGLKAIPIPVAPPAEATPAPPEIELKLTGIGTLVGSPKAFLEIIETKTKKAERLLPMAVGERHGDIEVVSIDPFHQTVRIRRGETETTLDFEKNGYRPGDLASATRGAAQTPGVSQMNPATPLQSIPSFPSARTDKVIVGGEGKLTAPLKQPLTLEEARAVIDLRREEMERNRAGSSIILPPTGTAPQQAAPPVRDSGAPVRFLGR